MDNMVIFDISNIEEKHIFKDDKNVVFKGKLPDFVNESTKKDIQNLVDVFLTLKANTIAVSDEKNNIPSLLMFLKLLCEKTQKFPNFTALGQSIPKGGKYVYNEYR